jgi:hypothetical protein
LGDFAWTTRLEAVWQDVRQAGRGFARSPGFAGFAVATLALGIGAAMLTRSLQNLTAVDLGWTPDGVLSLHASPPMPPELRRPWARFVDWSDQLIARLEALPDVTRAAITTQLPLASEIHPATLGLIKAATPDDGPSRVVGRVPARRTDSWQIVNPPWRPADDGSPSR